jgi:M3 family oligoendopeptidase
MNLTPRFSEMPYTRPSVPAAEATAEDLNTLWDASTTASEQLAVIRRWNESRIEHETHENLAMVRFQLDTTNEAHREEQAFFDANGPTFNALKLSFLKRVLGSQHRPALEQELGVQAFSLWDRFVASFDPCIAEEKRKAAATVTQYSELMASVRVDFRGKSYNLSAMRAFSGDPDRATRREAAQSTDKALAAHQADLDTLFEQLVQLRHAMALKMGFENFVPLGYNALFRTDYGAKEVEAFRAQVLEVVVPLATRIRDRRAKALGVDDYSLHDEPVRDSLGVPKPCGDHDWMLDQAAGMFESMGEDFSRFFSMMRDRELLDLKTRKGKAGGGFCLPLDRYDVPYIFANFNGTQDDVLVFTHECGHAFQTWSCRPQPVSDYHFPTYEAAEIHSMGLEMLTHSYMDRFFGEDAERFVTSHLEGAILFIPYGTLVDHFQHWVYENPNSGIQARAEAWQRLEALYLPHRRFDGTPYAASGRYWQRQMHIYCDPFYYIDYCLAQTCALQFWEQGLQDHTDTMKRYRVLCAKGGSESFVKLVEGAGLVNPFSEGALKGACEAVAKAIALN